MSRTLIPTLIPTFRHHWDLSRRHLLSGPVNIPQIRDVALIAFALSGSLQTWAMIANPFFSPAGRPQSERGPRVIESGPYRYMRHPGYLAMLISMPASALAIGSWLALLPAVAFVLVLARSTQLEDEFLKKNLPDYVHYARHVSARLFPFRRPIRSSHAKNLA